MMKRAHLNLECDFMPHLNRRRNLDRKSFVTMQIFLSNFAREYSRQINVF